MATQIPGSVLAALAARLDTLELTEEEHVALAVVLASGLETGRERPEVEGFTPNPVVLPSTNPFHDLEDYSFVFGKITVQNLSGGGSTTDDVIGGH